MPRRRRHPLRGDKGTGDHRGRQRDGRRHPPEEVHLLLTGPRRPGPPPARDVHHGLGVAGFRRPGIPRGDPLLGVHLGVRPPRVPRHRRAFTAGHEDTLRIRHRGRLLRGRDAGGEDRVHIRHTAIIQVSDLRLRTLPLGHMGIRLQLFVIRAPHHEPMAGHTGRVPGKRDRVTPATHEEGRIRRGAFIRRRAGHVHPRPLRGEHLFRTLRQERARRVPGREGDGKVHRG